MESFGALLSASLKETKKNFFAIAGICILSNFVALIPTMFFATSPGLILLFLIPTMIFQVWALIAIYQVMTESKFDLNWQLKRFQERFRNWMWGTLAAIHSVIAKFFPFFFPSIKESMSLMLASTALLFGNDDRIDVLKQSRAMTQGLLLKLFFFMVFVIGIIPQGLIKLVKVYGDPSLEIPVTIIISGLAATITTPLFVTLYIRRSAQVPFAPGTEPVDYKKMAVSQIPRALLGFVWLMIVVIVLTVGLVFLFKDFLPPPQPPLDSTGG